MIKGPIFKERLGPFLRIGVLLFLLFPFSLFSQLGETESHTQQWVHFSLQCPLGTKTSLQADAGLRWMDGFDSFSAYVTKLTAQYQANDSWSFALGFSHYGFYQDLHRNRLEYRPNQDFILEVPLGKLGFEHRLRIEERIFKEMHTEAQPYWFMRFRYRALIAVPIARIPHSQPNPNFSLEISDEISLNTRSENSPYTFDSNRIALTPILKLTKTSSVGLIYFFQFALRDQPKHHRIENVLALRYHHKLGPTARKARITNTGSE